MGCLGCWSLDNADNFRCGGRGDISTESDDAFNPSTHRMRRKLSSVPPSTEPVNAVEGASPACRRVVEERSGRFGT